MGDVFYGQLVSDMGGSGSSSGASRDLSSTYPSTVSKETFSCTGLSITNVSGSDTRLLGYFFFGWPQAVDHYEAQWYYLNDKGKWIAETVQNVSSSAYTQYWENGKLQTRRQTQYTVPSGVTVKSVKFRVRPVSKTHQVAVGTNKDGSTRYGNEPYFDKTKWAMSAAKTYAANLAAPAAPTNLSATLSGTNVRLSWQCSDPLATKVVVYRSTDRAGWGTVATLDRKASMSWTDTKCAVGHHYAYRLRALNGKSKKYSDYTQAVTVDEKPSRPKSLKATLANASGVKLTWENTGYVGTGFTVYYSDSLQSLQNNSLTNVQTKSFDGNMEKCQIDNLERGKTWYFRLRRKSGNLLSDYAYAASSTPSKAVMTVSMKLAADKKDEVTTPTKPTAQALYIDSGGVLRIVATVTGEKSGEKWEIQTSNASGWTGDTTRTITVEDPPKAIRKRNSDNAYGYNSSTPTGYTAVGKGVIYSIAEPGAGKRYYVRVRRVNDSKQSAWVTVGNILVPSSTAPAATAPTLEAAYANGEHLVVVFGNASSRKDETSEIQLSSVSSAFTDDAVRTMTYDGAYRTVYKKGSDYSYTSAAGWAAWQMGVIYTITNVEENTQYWIRVRRKNSAGTASAWSSVKTVTMPVTLQEGVPTDVPTTPSELTCAPQSDEHPENVRLDWAERSGQTPDVEYATYEIQWTKNAGAFADNAAGDIESATYETETPSATAQHFTVTGLDRGEQWWFRVRKQNEKGNGPWAAAKAGATYANETTCTLTVEPEAEVLTAPTTVATLAGYEQGDVINLSWTHNSEQESDQSAWEVEFRVTIDEVETTGTMSGEDATNVIAIDLGDLEIDVEGTGTTIQIPDGTLIEWRVRTKGVTDWSPWSGRRQFFVWAPPSVAISVLDGQGRDVADYGLTSMPLTVQVSSSGAAEQNESVEFWAEIYAAEDYDVDDYAGGGSHVGAGTVVWRGSITAGAAGFDPELWERVVSVSEVRLSNGVSYCIRGGTVTAQGIRADAEQYEFTPQWSADTPSPVAEVSFDSVSYAGHVIPSCVVAPTRSSMQSIAVLFNHLPHTISLGSAAVTDDTIVVVEAGGADTRGVVGVRRERQDGDHRRGRGNRPPCNRDRALGQPAAARADAA